MIIPLINPSSSRRRIARKVSRHLKGDIRYFRHEIREHAELMKQLRKINPRRPPKAWWDRHFSQQLRRGYSTKSARRITGDIWYHRMTRAQRLAKTRKLESPALLSRGLSTNPSTKGCSMRYSLLRSKTRRHKRRARRRHNPRFGYHRPSLLFGRGGWRRPRRSRLFSRRTRINPRKRRHYRHYRRNPMPRLPFNILGVAMGGLKIAGGIAGGFLLKPIITGFIPKDRTTGLPMFVNFFGLIYVVGGAMLAATIRQKDVKDVALVLAGVGVYDLIASNLRMLGLPTLPYASAAAVTAGNEPGVIGMGASYQPVGADYAPALGASFREQRAGADDIAYGDDVMELD